MTQSNEPTIEQMNEAIAKFMGYYFHVDKFYSNNIYPGRGTWFKKAKYDTSWEWLMEVGKKIRDLLTDMAKKRPPHTACHGDLIEVDIRCAVSSYDIESAHKNMYIFIKWYNEYQQKQNDGN